MAITLIRLHQVITTDGSYTIVKKRTISPAVIPVIHDVVRS